jgi:hypothetical protein
VARVPRPRGPDRAGDGGAERRLRRAPLPLAAAVATGWAAILSVAPVVAVVAVAHLADAPRFSIAEITRYGLAGWLLAHGVPLRTPLGPVGIAPLALAAFAAWRVLRAGVHTARAIGGRRSRSPRMALTAAVAVAVVYALIGAGAAGLAGGADLAIDPRRAGLTLGGFGFAAALAGALPTTGVSVLMLRRLPDVVRDGLRAGIVGALLVLALGAALAGLAVALAGGQATETLASYRTGVAGQAAITLLCLAYAPNLAAWGASYALGPGFAVGSDTVVTTHEVTIGAVPALPVFAGLPPGPLPGVGGLLAGAPLAAAMAAGWLLARRRLRRDPGWLPLLGAAAVAGPVAGGLLGLAAWVSAGSIGAGRLAAVGPVPWQVAAVGAAIALLGALLGAAATRAVFGARSSP